MDKVQSFGLILLMIGLILFPLQMFYDFLFETHETMTEIPFTMRMGMGMFFMGMIILMTSLVRERIIDWKKER